MSSAARVVSRDVRRVAGLLRQFLHHLVGHVLPRVPETARQRGLLTTLRAACGWALGYVLGRRRLFRSVEHSFELEGRRYEEFHHRYNWTWLNERAVEVPIVWELVRAARPQAVLEVGNVLSHYFDAEHDVVDRYEPSAGVIKEDVVSYSPEKRYELIVSISTLEHVGWDEEPREPGKAIAAIQHLHGLLAPGGRLVFTVPAGYNPELERRLRDGTVSLTGRACLRFDSRRSGWVEADCDSVGAVPYDELLYAASVIFVGTIEAD